MLDALALAHPDRLRLSLPFAPVAKGRPRFTRAGRTYTPAKTARAEDALRLAVEERLPAYWVPFHVPVALHVQALLPVPKSIPKRDRGTARPTTRPDVDNYAKTVLDALNGLVLVDDSLVVDLAVSKDYAWDGQPRWEVEVYALR